MHWATDGIVWRGQTGYGTKLATPSVPAAIVTGVAGGLLALALLQLAAVAVYDEAPWKLMRMLAALARGPSVLEPEDEYDGAVVAIALALSLSLAVAYSLAFAALSAEAPARVACALGIAFGVALYFAHLHGFTALFPWFASHRTPDTLAVHAIFGLILGLGCRPRRA